VTVWRGPPASPPGRPAHHLDGSDFPHRAIDRCGQSAVIRRPWRRRVADAVSDPSPAAVERFERAQHDQRLSRCREELEAPTGSPSGAFPGRHQPTRNWPRYERAARHHEELDSNVDC